MTEVLTMPFPAAWRDGLLTENYAGLARSEVLTCQATIEKLRHESQYQLSRAPYLVPVAFDLLTRPLRVRENGFEVGDHFIFDLVA